MNWLMNGGQQNVQFIYDYSNLPIQGCSISFVINDIIYNVFYLKGIGFTLIHSNVHLKMHRQK